ncbi:MAG: hypothetical protein E7514_00555 [Ruminococcaceae bacterium]|nr:hypothetical protein [Oscillospiraceae bacterium]
MNLKLTPLKRFIIRNHSVLSIVFVIVAVILIHSMFITLNMPMWALFLIDFTVCFPICVYIETLGTLMLRKIETYLNNELDLYGTVKAADSFLEILKPNQYDYIGTAQYIKAVALYDMGETGEAEKLALDFTREAEKRGKAKFQCFEMHGFLTSIYLRKHDFDEYSKQLGLAESSLKKCKSIYRKLAEKNKLMLTLRRNLKLYNAEEYDEKFEKWLTDSLVKGPDGKPYKTEPNKLYRASVYSKLFEYFKTLGIKDRQLEYAEKITEICNEQFKIYRDAKELLENAN